MSLVCCFHGASLRPPPSPFLLSLPFLLLFCLSPWIDRGYILPDSIHSHTTTSVWTPSGGSYPCILHGSIFIPQLLQETQDSLDQSSPGLYIASLPPYPPPPLLLPYSPENTPLMHLLYACISWHFIYSVYVTVLASYPSYLCCVRRMG